METINLEENIEKTIICNNAIDDYCFYTGKDPERNLSKEEKNSIVEKRIIQLKKTEWQRWFPGIGAYRIINDILKDENILLNEIRSSTYNATNLSYNIGIMFAIGKYLFT